MSLGEYDPCLTDWLGIAENQSRPAACCRICRNLRGDHPPTAVLTGLKRVRPLSAACLMWFPPHSAPD
ncbi:hypothetical protein ACLK19_24150 [Escherichia coli]